ncbi:MAG TPA: 6-carboxytetrahydropterin synthase [Bdellovibrionales bacterium]|jgi:6-pyruvoyltetrahydropterin/6-carboxytetrahydropterin synthase|nr:6-carboxytetrahydropterin synthase [Bdellovibrionales bacterium]
MQAFDAGLSVKVVRVATFSAAHRYFNHQLSIEENKKIYGSLYREDGFGHNFAIEAHFSGPIDPMTGMIVNLVDIDSWLKDVTRVVDHQNLNLLPAFQQAPPTPETIARFFFTELTTRIGGKVQLEKVRVFEGDDLWVDYSG